jgi:hypothetical protein
MTMKWYRIKQLVDLRLLPYKQGKIRLLIKEGKLESKKDGYNVVVSDEAIERYIASNFR